MTDELAARHRLATDLLWAVYTAVTMVGVFIAMTTRTWDTILSACVLCFLRGWWRNG